MIPDSLLRCWKIELILLLVALNVVFINAWRHEVKAYADYRAGVAVAAKVQEEHTAQVKAEQERLTEETVNGWKAAVDYLRTHPVGVLPRACTGQLPAVPGTSAGADGPGQGAVPAPDRIEADVAEDVLKLNHLQGWLENMRNVR